MKLEVHRGSKVTEPDFSGKLIFRKMGEKGPKRSKRSKNRVFWLLWKIESLVFARNGLKWSVLWLADFMRKFHIWENSYCRDLYTKALYQSDRSIFQINIPFEPFNRFYIFCMKIEYHQTFSDDLSLLWKMSICPQKGQKGAKMGGAVGKNNLFCILLKFGSLFFFLYFA